MTINYTPAYLARKWVSVNVEACINYTPPYLARKWVSVNVEACIITTG